jgi:release factor glutamine methyltransferase
VPVPHDLAALAALLSAAGFIAADEEADELLACAAGDVELLDSLVARRLTGEPLAWITGCVWFCGVRIRVDPGVYVPRWQSEQLARRAVDRLPATGAAIDLCTGAGPMARVLATERPGARVVASDVDERAVTCAAANGVEVYRGDLFDPLPDTLAGRVDVVVGVVPYVPTPELPMLQRDTFAFESPLSYDGGRDGTEILRRVVTGSPRFLRRGGALLLELGGEQADALGDDLARLGYVDVTVLVDDDGDVRGIEATLGGARPWPYAPHRSRPPGVPHRRGLTGPAAARVDGLRTLPLAPCDPTAEACVPFLMDGSDRAALDLEPRRGSGRQQPAARRVSAAERSLRVAVDWGASTTR